MENITITVSEDQNTITVSDKTFVFNPIVEEGEEYNHCAHCDAFSICCELEETVESSFPFPCLPQNRKDGKNGILRQLE